MTIQFPPMQSSGRDAFVYYGEREGWLIALSQHRDSDSVDRSNWAVITEDVLSAAGDTGDAAIESTSHFLVGWVEYLLVRPDSLAHKRALEWANKLDNYPLANEDHHSMLEWQEEWCLKCDGATREQHPTARCSKFRGEWEAESILYKWNNRH